MEPKWKEGVFANPATCGLTPFHDFFTSFLNLSLLASLICSESRNFPSVLGPLTVRRCQTGLGRGFVGVSVRLYVKSGVSTPTWISVREKTSSNEKVPS